MTKLMKYIKEQINTWQKTLIMQSIINDTHKQHIILLLSISATYIIFEFINI